MIFPEDITLNIDDEGMFNIGQRVIDLPETGLKEALRKLTKDEVNFLAAKSLDRLFRELGEGEDNE